jgi:hypothetical protein
VIRFDPYIHDEVDYDQCTTWEEIEEGLALAWGEDVRDIDVIDFFRPISDSFQNYDIFIRVALGADIYRFGLQVKKWKTKSKLEQDDDGFDGRYVIMDSGSTHKIGKWELIGPDDEISAPLLEASSRFFGATSTHIMPAQCEAFRRPGQPYYFKKNYSEYM